MNREKRNRKIRKNPQSCVERIEISKYDTQIKRISIANKQNSHG